jgi:flagellar basal-body rod protein FlgB
MAIGGVSIIDGLKTRMQWHQARQKVLAQNVANADTPGFRPSDVKSPVPQRGGLNATQPVLTQAGHMTITGGVNGFDGRNPNRFETTPSGNGVNLEDEMIKVAQNQSDYQLAASLYSKSLMLLKMAIGKGR